jgi:hypothetical protein
MGADKISSPKSRTRLCPKITNKVPIRTCQGHVVTMDLPTIGTSPKPIQNRSTTLEAKDLAICAAWDRWSDLRHWTVRKREQKHHKHPSRIRMVRPKPLDGPMMEEGPWTLHERSVKPTHDSSPYDGQSEISHNKILAPQQIDMLARKNWTNMRRIGTLRTVHRDPTDDPSHTNRPRNNPTHEVNST